ncbi:hypothetical protein O6H91_17G038200 [Diphasiastrum complanatum]|uniref:Uncharacterized protein n=1 Tax=Diphasiastrum complanatum TaxID=34168 RepID=A0ACC2B5Z8_DIPCM|nr:hypothetical protein O6H91_17G038200 [Diphasiastrum complanatum]
MQADTTYEKAKVALLREELMREEEFHIHDDTAKAKGSKQKEDSLHQAYYAGQKQNNKQKGKGKDNKCQHCGKVGHSKNSYFCNPYISCRFCKKTGHAAAFCDKRPQDSFKNAFKGKQQETETRAVIDVADKSRQPGKSFPDEKPECSYHHEPEYNCAYIAQTSTKCMQNDTEKSVSIYVPMNLSPIVHFDDLVESSSLLPQPHTDLDQMSPNSRLLKIFFHQASK